jgi:putative proteasome-type protease
MTYCIGIALDEGLVFASDSRTNAGIDHAGTYPKMHRFVWPGERLFILLASGNLATTQALVRRLERDAARKGAPTSLRTVPRLTDAADYIGDLNVSIQAIQSSRRENSGVNYQASFILGGQIGQDSPELYLIYPEGNHIAPSPYHPFLQIGEIKYGKPILDRIIRQDSSLEAAGRCALVSLDSTMRSNLSVGPPLDLLLYRSGSLVMERLLRFGKEDPYLRRLRQEWREGLEQLFHSLPTFDWETHSVPSSVSSRDEGD